MNHNQALQKYLGTFQREPGINSAECVAWVKLYNKEAFDITLAPFYGSAYSGWTYNKSFPLDKYDRIPYKLGTAPPIGASLFWDTNYNPKYGHTAIADEGSTSSELHIIEQNGTGKPGDKPGDEIKRSIKTYKGLVGWYAPKNGTDEPQMPINDLRAIWKNVKHKFNDYSKDERIKMLIDIGFHSTN